MTLDDIFGTLQEGTRNGVGLNLFLGQVYSPEIVEIVEEHKSMTSVQDRRDDDVYVAVGKDDLDVVKWALDHAVSPSARIFVIHVSSPYFLSHHYVLKL